MALPFFISVKGILYNRGTNKEGIIDTVFHPSGYGVLVMFMVNTSKHQGAYYERACLSEKLAASMESNDAE